METSESVVASYVSTSDSAVSIADELADRERRKRNLIMYNVPETTDRRLDKSFFDNLCKTVYNLNVPTTKVFRLGKRKDKNEQPQHRPLLVALENQSHKHILLSCSGQLRCCEEYKNVYIVSDKTKFERMKHKKLVDELKQRRACVEKNLIIRNGSILTKPLRSQPIVNDD